MLNITCSFFLIGKVNYHFKKHYFMEKEHEVSKILLVHQTHEPYLLSFIVFIIFMV